MNRRVPLYVAVVGALLVGGATTGTTRASWVDQGNLQAASVSSGAMGLQASSSPGSLSMTKGSSATTLVSVTDTSTPAAKNLQQRVTLARTGPLPSGVSATLTTRSGPSCSSTTQGSVTLDPGDGLTACLTVSASSSTSASSATVTVDVTGVQVRGGSTGGWTATPRTVTVPVSIRPDEPQLTCGEFARNGVRAIRWTNRSGETYSIWAAYENRDGDYFLVDDSVTSPYEQEVPQGMTVFGRVRAHNAAGQSDWSNTVRMRRTGNGSHGISCQTVTP